MTQNLNIGGKHIFIHRITTYELRTAKVSIFLQIPTYDKLVQRSHDMKAKSKFYYFCENLFRLISIFYCTVGHFVVITTSNNAIFTQVSCSYMKIRWCHLISKNKNRADSFLELPYFSLVGTQKA